MRCRSIGDELAIWQCFKSNCLQIARCRLILGASSRVHHKWIRSKSIGESTRSAPFVGHCELCYSHWLATQQRQHLRLLGITSGARTCVHSRHSCPDDLWSVVVVSALYSPPLA